MTALVLLVSIVAATPYQGSMAQPVPLRTLLADHGIEANVRDAGMAFLVHNVAPEELDLGRTLALASLVKQEQPQGKPRTIPDTAARAAEREQYRAYVADLYKLALEDRSERTPTQIANEAWANFGPSINPTLSNSVCAEGLELISVEALKRQAIGRLPWVTRAQLPGSAALMTRLIEYFEAITAIVETDEERSGGWVNYERIREGVRPADFAISAGMWGDRLHVQVAVYGPARESAGLFSKQYSLPDLPGGSPPIVPPDLEVAIPDELVRGLHALDLNQFIGIEERSKNLELAYPGRATAWALARAGDELGKGVVAWIPEGLEGTMTPFLRPESRFALGAWLESIQRRPNGLSLSVDGDVLYAEPRQKELTRQTQVPHEQLRSFVQKLSRARGVLVADQLEFYMNNGLASRFQRDLEAIFGRVQELGSGRTGAVALAQETRRIVPDGKVCLVGSRLNPLAQEWVLFSLATLGFHIADPETITVVIDSRTLPAFHHGMFDGISVTTYPAGMLDDSIRQLPGDRLIRFFSRTEVRATIISPDGASRVLFYLFDTVGPYLSEWIRLDAAREEARRLGIPDDIAP